MRRICKEERDSLKGKYQNIIFVELENTEGNDQNKTVSFSYQDVITRDVRMMLLEN